MELRYSVRRLPDAASDDWQGAEVTGKESGVDGPEGLEGDKAMSNSWVKVENGDKQPAKETSTEKGKELHWWLSLSRVWG